MNHADPPSRSAAPAPPSPPAVYHITPWKAGSAWVQGVLLELEAERVLIPPAAVADGIEFCAVEPGRVYSPLYLNRHRFDESPFAAAPHRRFVVIRDLRDTLVSWYFSLAKTHDENPVVLRHRQELQAMDKESALLHLTEHEDFYGLTMIASTWLEAGDTLVVRFENLIEEPDRWFRVILGECGLEASDERLAAALAARSFENLAGRPRGTEGPPSHYRRGEAGDWKRHFTPRMAEAFAMRFDDLLIKCGYEPTLR